MSREEDLIRSTTHAIASTVRDVPPLNLEMATDELRSPARTRRRGRGRSWHWWSWGTPLTAAAMVVALATTLVLVKDIPNGGAVPGGVDVVPTADSTVASPSASGPGGIPRYYVALEYPDGKPRRARVLVVGDSLTGKRLATFPPPTGVLFIGVTAAADDLTFVVSALTGSGSRTARSWFEVRLAPGTADPARLISLAIKPQPVTPEKGRLAAELALSFPTALSASGTELAVAQVASGGAGMAVGVFSVATGQLLHGWTTNDPSLSLPTDATHGLQQVPMLTWIDGDSALVLTTVSRAVGSATTNVLGEEAMRRLNVNGAASGDLMTDSKVIWDVRTGYDIQTARCGLGSSTPLVSADGKTYSCVSTIVPPGSESWHVSFRTNPLTAEPTAAGVGRTDYDAPAKTAEGQATLLWTSPSGGTLIGEWSFGSNATGVAVGLHIGVISHGRFTPLAFPTGFSLADLDITW